MFNFHTNETLASIKQLFFNRGFMLSILICLVWASKFLDILRGVVNRLPILCDYIDETVAVVVAIPVLFSLPILISKYTIADYVFYVVCVIVYILNFFFYPDNWDALSENAFFCLCAVFPCYFIGRILDVEKFFTFFVILAGICIVWDVFYFLYFVQTAKSANEMKNILMEDNMGAAYLILPHVLLMIWATMKKFSILKLLLSLVGLISILSYGSRGPLACIGLFVIVYFFVLMKFKYSEYVKIAIIGFALLVLSFIKEFAIFFKILFTELNLSTRIIDRVLGGGLSHDSGRGWLTDKLYSLLDNSGNIFGFGMFGSQRYGYIYSHNFVCDMYITFGYIIGTMIMIVLAIVFVGGVITCRTQYEKGFILLLFCATVVKLFLSSTFLFEPLFFMLIGYCIKNIVNYQRIKNKKLSVNVI